MAQYVVKSGDTLSKIGSQYGVDWRQISGFKSGNPNLIRPGEVLNIPDRPGATSSPSPAPASQAPAATPSYSAPAPSSISGNTPEGIPLSSLPPDLVWNNTLDVSNPVKKQKYDQLVAQYRQNNPAASSGPRTSASAFSLPSQPTVDLSSIYTKAIEESTKAVQPEIDASAGEVAAIQARINEKRRKQAEKEAEIGDNPFLAESTMTGRLAKIQDKANKDIAIDETELAIAQNKSVVAQNKVAQAKADAQVKLNIAAQQYNIQSQQYQQNLQMFTNLLTAGALETASGQDLAQIATTTGMSTSMIQSIVDSQKKKNAPKPSLITTDDGTNQYVVAINPETGSVIKKEVIGKSAPKTTGVGDTGYGKLSDKYVDNAVAVLTAVDKEWHTPRYQEPDKALSAEEQQEALRRITALVGDPNQAYEILQRAFKAGGFKSWTP